MSRAKTKQGLKRKYGRFKNETLNFHPKTDPRRQRPDNFER